ncbi:4Fe-4S dicluster domain-containing protein [Bdellovibrionota bacterium FG-2]
MAHMINKACTKCGACLLECPTASIIEGAEQFFIDSDTCADHLACVNVCPVDAIVARPAPPVSASHAKLGDED